MKLFRVISVFFILCLFPLSFSLQGSIAEASRRTLSPVSSDGISKTKTPSVLLLYHSGEGSSPGIAVFSPASSEPDSLRWGMLAQAKEENAIQASETGPSENISKEEAEDTISDPLEPVNRVFFHFNDKLYFWALKPIASGYRWAVPQVARVSVRNFFSNVATPVRLVNCLLQAKFEYGGTETARFFINTTLGIAGLFDPAKSTFHLEKRKKDTGTTLGFWGIGPIIYFNWPILGPSSLRDTAGYVGDIFLDPQTYLITSTPINLGVRTFDRVNETSLSIGDYEDLKEASIDPYVALKDAYYQYRKRLINE